MPLVSVIIPIYKVEKYLDQCVRSVMNQTYKNLEIILVDDGSLDNCPEMCDEYAKEDSRIVVIHKENGGLSDARNAGLDVAKGEYICFVDSDDWVDEKYVEMMERELESTSSDLVICDFEIIYECGTQKLLDSTPLKKEIIDKESYMYKPDGTAGYKYVIIWNKLFRKELLDDFRFNVGKIHEDEFAFHKIADSISKVSVIDRQLYYYRQRSNSITASKVSGLKFDAEEARIDRMLYMIDNGYTENSYARFINIREAYVKKKDKLKTEHLRIDFDIRKKFYLLCAKVLPYMTFKDKMRCMFPDLVEGYLSLKSLLGG